MKINPVVVLSTVAAVLLVIAVATTDYVPRRPLPSTATEAQINTLDLLAQQNMADAAWLMIWVTGISSVVGAVGIFLVWGTLVANNRSADAAEKALRLGHRAYMLIRGVKISYSERWDGLLTYGFANSGNAPAINVSIKVTVYVALDRTGERYLVREVTQSRSDIPPGSSGTGKLTIPDYPHAMENALGEHRDVHALIVVFELRYGDLISEKNAYLERSTYGRFAKIVPKRESDPDSLYRDVGGEIGWGD